MTEALPQRSPVDVVIGAEQTPKRIGLMVLSTDHTIERDFARICPADQIAVFASRLLYENPTTPENLRKMEPRLAEAASLILPEEALDAICYGCTSASMVLGDRSVIDAVHAARPGVPVVTPALGARLAMQALGLSRLSVLTPYLEVTSRSVIEYFTRHGLEVINLDCFGLEDDRVMARVTLDTLLKAAEAATRPEAEALFISCTALRAVEVVEAVEQRIGRPVITANQAAAWLTLRWAGIDTAVEGFGRLLRLPAKTRPDDL